MASPHRLLRHATLAAGVLLGLSAPADAADPAGSPFAPESVAAVEELEEQRGRFVLPNGAVLDLVLSSTQMINGQTVNRIELSSAGSGGLVNVRALAGGIAADIHNSIDNAVIRNLNSLTLNYTRPPNAPQAVLGSLDSYRSTLSIFGGR